MYMSPTRRPRQMLAVSLAFLFTGLVACSRGSAGEQTAGAGKPATAPSPATAAGSPAAAPAGAQPAAPAAGKPTPTAAAPGTPAAGAPGAPPAGPGTPPAPAAQPLAPEKLPPVVAKVNGQEIKKDELVKSVQQMQGRMAEMGRGEVADAAFYRHVLDRMIGQRLLEQEAKTAGVTATDDEVKGQIDKLKHQFKSEEDFKKELAREGMSEAQLMDEARKGFTLQKFIETRIASQVKVSDEQVQAFYNQNKDKLQQPARVHLRHVLIKVDPKAAAEEKKKAKDKADAILARVKAGEDFGKLAREGSDDPGSKDNGGDLSWVSKGQTVPPFEKAAFALQKPNDISPVVESQFGYHVIQLVEKKDAGLVPLAEVKDNIASFLKNKEIQQKLEDHVKELRDKSGKDIQVFI
jgi:peptidyl-prolyl cis-trans isomerase C